MESIKGSAKREGRSSPPLEAFKPAEASEGSDLALISKKVTSQGSPIKETTGAHPTVEKQQTTASKSPTMQKQMTA